MSHTKIKHIISALTISTLFACGGEPASINNDTTMSADMNQTTSDMGSQTSTDMGSTMNSDMSSTQNDMDTTTPFQTGMTSCGALPTGEAIECQPSQYCKDSTLNQCELGCLSDMNCPGNEECNKEEGRNTGLCQRKAGDAGIPPDEPNRTGMTECGFNVFENSTVECQPSQYCKDSTLNQCEAGCLSDMNCPGDEICTKESGRSVGTCSAKPVTDPCDNVTCSAGEVCSEGSCVSTDPCDGVTCNAGKVCSEGTCVSTDPCAGVSCGAGEVCQQGMCVSNDPCATVTCNSGQVCENGTCVVRSCVPNGTAQDGCATNQICGYDANDNPVCYELPPCDAQGECDPGVFGAVCSSEFISGKDPQCIPETCVDDTHCPASQYCYREAGFPAGFCETGEFGSFCNTNSQCQAGLECDSFTGTCF